MIEQRGGLMKNIMLCLLSVAVLVCGQLLFRYATSEIEVLSLSDLFKILFSPYAMIAIALYASATLLWIYILTRMPISHAYPIQALAFPLVVIFSVLLFQEAVPINRWIGVVVIVLGVIIASK